MVRKINDPNEARLKAIGFRPQPQYDAIISPGIDKNIAISLSLEFRESNRKPT
jgi:hypothetical protein